MSPLKSALLGLSAGLLAYVFAANVGGDVISGHGGDSDAGTELALVTESVAPGATKVPGGAKSSGTKVAQGAKVLAPTLTPIGTAVAPVTPRPTTPLSASTSPTHTPISSPLPPSASPVVPRSHTPTPTPTPSPTATLTPISSPLDPSDTPTPIPSTLTPSRVVINEIAWAGTATSSADEWIELYNAGDGDQDLSGWFLRADDGKPDIALSGSIGAGEFYLIERTDDMTVSDISADVVTAFGTGLSNTGESLKLIDAVGSVVDAVPQWFGVGSASPDYCSMERISADAAGDSASNWATWGTIPDSDKKVNSTGLDAAGQPLNGTPKFKNSVSQ